MKWEEWEIQYIKDNYYDSNIDDISKHLGRSKSAVVQFAGKMNLKNKRFYTKEQTELIRELYGVIPTSELAEMVGRSAKCINDYACRLSIPHRSLWTEDEIRYLKRNYGTYGVHKCAKKLGRTVQAVNTKAYLIGIGGFANNSDLLNMSTVASLIGINKGLVSKWNQKGKIKFKKIGCMEMISEKNLCDFMISNPNMWDATKCEKYFFERYDWFREKLVIDRKKHDEERWGKWVNSGKSTKS